MTSRFMLAVLLSVILLSSCTRWHLATESVPGHSIRFDPEELELSMDIGMAAALICSPPGHDALRCTDMRLGTSDASIAQLHAASLIRIHNDQEAVVVVARGPGSATLTFAHNNGDTTEINVTVRD